MKNLKPCPFCSQKAMLVEDGNNFLIACKVCQGATYWKDSKEQAIEVWNCRASTTNEWKDPSKILPRVDRQVLCFMGNKRFGSYAICEIKTDEEGLLAWRVYGEHIFDAGFGDVHSWQDLPEAPV